VIAAPGKAEQPLPQRTIEARPDAKRAVRLQQRFEDASESARTRKRQHMARTYKATVSMRATPSEPAGIHDGHFPALAHKIVSAGSADHAAAHHDDGAIQPIHPAAGAARLARLSHVRMPARKGSLGS